MAEFGSAVITRAGAELLANVMAANKKIEFTALTVGDGEYSESDKSMSAMQNMTGLKHERLSFLLSSVKPYSDTAVRLKAIVTNVSVTNGFYINEIGIWARDTTSGADPILYSIVAANVPDYLPAYNGTTPSTIEQDWITTLSNEASVTITMDSSAYASSADVEELRCDVYNIISVQEESMTASHHYGEGDYFIYAGHFYKTLAEITEGDILIEDDNIQLTTIAQEIRSGAGVDLATEEDIEELVDELMEDMPVLGGGVATDDDVEYVIDNLDDL